MLLCHVLKHMYNPSLAMIKDGAAAYKQGKILTWLRKRRHKRRLRGTSGRAVRLGVIVASHDVWKMLQSKLEAGDELNLQAEIKRFNGDFVQTISLTCLSEHWLGHAFAHRQARSAKGV